MACATHETASAPCARVCTAMVDPSPARRCVEIAAALRDRIARGATDVLSPNASCAPGTGLRNKKRSDGARKVDSISAASLRGKFGAEQAGE